MSAPNLHERSIFDIARRIESPDERQAYLDKACIDAPHLKGRIEALLRVHDLDRSFLESPADGVQSLFNDQHFLPNREVHDQDKSTPWYSHGVAVVFLLLVGTVAWLAFRKMATQHEELRAQQNAELAKARAEMNAVVTRAVSDFLQTDLLGQVSIDGQVQVGNLQRNRTLRELLDQASKKINAKFAGQSRAEAAVCYALGNAYRALNDLTEAQKYLERSVELLNAQLGADDPESISSKLALGLLHADRDEFAIAELFIKEVVDDRRKRLGDDHQQTLAAMNELGALHLNRGQLDLAEPLFRDVSERTGGCHDLIAPRAKSNLAKVHVFRAQYDQAEPLFVEVLARLRSNYGAEHPETLQTLQNLALLNRDRGRFDDALRLLNEALVLRRNSLGVDHPDTLATMQAMALVRWDAGRLSEAESLLKQTWAACQSRLDPDHPVTLEFCYKLSALYCDLGRYAEAEHLARDCVAIQGKFKSDRWTTFHAQSILGTALLGQNKFADAEPLLLQGYEGMKQREVQIPLRQRSTLTKARDHLVQLYNDWGKPAEAEKWRDKSR